MPQKFAFKKIWLYLLFCVVFLLIIKSLLGHQKINPLILSGFLLGNLFIFIFFFKYYSAKILNIQSYVQHDQEAMNLLVVENKKNQNFNLALKSKITRYANLKQLIEDLNQTLKLDVLVRVLSSTVYKLIANSLGVALFYLVDNQNQKLKLVYSIKNNPDLVVFSKEGDIFDQWVLRHSSPLVIDNLKNDFRFDAASLSAQDNRAVLSLVSSPLISHNSLLGLLRLESKESGFFDQDDLRFLALVSDLGAMALENSLLFEKTQDLAIHDDLTGLYTRGYFIDHLKDQARRAQRLDQHLSLLMVDIDFFKQYNDKFGHIVGDLVLKKMGALLKDVLNEWNPLLCRFGGEEFLVMLPGMDKQKSLLIAEELRRRIQAEKIVLRRQVTSITVSIGVASLPRDTKDEEELVLKADKAMYQAKEKGRNQVCSI